MQSTVAILFEYQKYSFKIGNENRFIGKEFTFTESTLNVLTALNDDKKFLVIGYDTIKPRNLVGVLKVEDITIQIFPKLFKDRIEEHEDIVARNVLKMFANSDYFPIKNIDESDLVTDELDMFEVFIGIFAKNLISLLKSNRHRDYIKRSEKLHFVREKINTKNYGNPAKLHVIPCTYHEFSIDTTLNRTLKYTVYLLSKRVESIVNFQMLKEINSILEDVTLEPIDIDKIDTISYNRLNDCFKPYIEICKIFLQNSTLSLQASQIDTFSLLIPMERLFESFIANLLQQNQEYFFDPDVTVSKQKCIGHLVKSLDGSKDNDFRLIPDIVIEGRNEKYIIDTKYKLLNRNDTKLGVSQQTMYQMYAYATKSRAKSIILLYPDLGEKIEGNWSISYNSGNDTTNLHARCVNLSYDLCDEVQDIEFRQDLKNILSPLRKTMDGI